MKNTNIIMFNEEYVKLLNELEEFERQRPFCKHDLAHFLDVARICYIMNLEKGLGLEKDLIYTTALLHDIGRIVQYKEGTDHDIASVEIAKKLLPLTDFSQIEKDMIIDCIKKHRKSTKSTSFNEIFYSADKLSRICFRCPAYDICYWPKEKKNHKITY
ncbi:MAG: HD domain-containing protein [Lagierella massiliensis]|nr:HD domain-containing protein [Lagierella massiliensis]